MTPSTRYTRPGQSPASIDIAPRPWLALALAVIVLAAVCLLFGGCQPAADLTALQTRLDAVIADQAVAVAAAEAAQQAVNADPQASPEQKTAAAVELAEARAAHARATAARDALVSAAQANEERSDEALRSLGEAGAGTLPAPWSTLATGLLGAAAAGGAWWRGRQKLAAAAATATQIVEAIEAAKIPTTAGDTVNLATVKMTASAKALVDDIQATLANTAPPQPLSCEARRAQQDG